MTINYDQLSEIENTLKNFPIQTSNCNKKS